MHSLPGPQGGSGVWVARGTQNATPATLVLRTIWPTSGLDEAVQKHSLPQQQGQALPQPIQNTLNSQTQISFLTHQQALCLAWIKLANPWGHAREPFLPIWLPKAKLASSQAVLSGTNIICSLSYYEESK